MSSQSSQVVESWIAGFCNLLGHEYFAEVSEDFIEDDFNLTGLSSQVPLYKDALEMILDVEPEEEDEEEEEEEEEDDDDEALERLQYRRSGDRPRQIHDVSMIESSAELLYGLIHQRYINSRPGMQQMHDKYHAGHFGRCPRVFCGARKVLPVGISDTPGEETVKLFCPSCLDVYTPPNSRFQTVDGAFFGTTFGCLFLMSYPELQGSRNAHGIDEMSDAIGTPPFGDPALDRNLPFDINGVQSNSLAPGLGRTNIYEPRVFGFRVNERAKSGPRMQWLRTKPDDLHELDETKRFHAEDMDEDMADGNGSPSQLQSVDKRKKAPMRRRRRLNSGTSGEAEVKEVNGTR